MRQSARAGWVVLACIAAGISALPAASPPPPAAAPAGDPATAPAAAQPADKPPTLLDVALLSADRWAIARMRREKDNLTWQSSQLTALTRLLARASRFDQALALIEKLDTPARVKVEAYAPIALAYLRAGDKARAAALAKKVTAIGEWTTSPALAEIARGMDAAGDRAGALRLAATIPAGADRADVLFEMGRYREAVDAARDIAPGSFHVDCRGDGSHCWVEDWDQRQAFLVKLVKALVDQGDLVGAHAAATALDEVDGFSTKEWRAQALVELARREEPVAMLHQALAVLDNSSPVLPKDYMRRAETLAHIAESLAAAGQRTQAVGLMPRALAALGPTDSVDSMEISAWLGSESLTRIARAHFAIGQREQALALLAHTERLIDAMAVPPPEKSAGSDWDSTSSTQHERVEARLYVAAALEAAGESEQAERVLNAALAELAKIGNPEWREYGWRSLVEAYRDAGVLDRAMAVLTADSRTDAERWMAIEELSDDELLAAPRPQLWGLLDALPPGGGKAVLAGRLARQLDARGEATSVTRLATEALTSLAAVAAARDRDWQLTLVALGGELPGAERPGTADQQRLVRQLLAAVQGKASPAGAGAAKMQR
ncbi:MAG TPA: hypothetical protein VGS57_04775 [Thermoanaerobaculia bacterium]|jgi:tetratricopeptide (TPR) repeat protein|nr:hypothetical protein [Thermoanaerobaculia bacterium]